MNTKLNKIYKIYNIYKVYFYNFYNFYKSYIYNHYNRYKSYIRRKGRRYFAWATLASMVLQLVLPLAGLIQPLQANNLIKPTQKGDSLFESVNPGFTAEFGDKSEPTAHRLRFEAEPSYNGYKSYKDYSAEKPSAFQRAKEAVLGAESKGVELRLIELGEAAVPAAQPTASPSADYNDYKSYKDYKELGDLKSQLQDVESGLEKLETGITSVSKDVAEVTKVTKNILEESGVGKPELSVRPSMEETPEDFAKTAGYNNYNDYNGYTERPAPPATLTAPIDTVSQTIDETTKVEYQVIVGRGVKESITLLEKDAILPSATEGSHPSTFTFELKLDQGVQVRQTIDGIQSTSLNSSGFVPSVSLIYFTDEFGRYLFHFQDPFMIDAAGARSSAVKLELSTQEKQELNGTTQEKTPAFSSNIPASSGVLYLKVTADPAWLQAEARVYPILIDPTIVHENNPAFSSGTENRSQTTNTPAVEIQFKELQPDINTAGLWHFNEGSSTTAYDASGNNNTGTLTNGPVWNGPTDTLTGLGKSSLKFDDANDYVTTADAASLDLTTNGTIEAWVKPNAIEDNNWIVCKASNYCVGLNSTGAVLYTGASAQNDGGTGVTTANQWYHIAVTNNNTTATYYVNGVTTGTDAVAWGSTLTNALEFGRDGGTNYFDGTIDEIRISNVVRSPEEIAASASRYPYAVHESPVIDFGSTPNTLDSLNYSATGVQTGDGEKPFSSDGLVAQWNFNETSGTAAYNTGGADSCGGTPSSCNLTLNNFASTSSQDQAAGTGWTANDRKWGAGAINISSVATADTLSLSNPSTLDPNSADLSIETWVKTTDVTAELFSNNSGNGVSCTSDGYYLGIDASGYPVFTLDTDGVTAGCDATITTGITKKINDGTWHHLAATVKLGSAAYLYMDGALIGSDTSITAYASEAPSGNVLIGSTNNFDGTLDSARFYSRALTASEVLANAQSGNIEFQTRTGTTATPNDGTWEAWKTTSGTGDTQIASMDTDSANWSEDNQNPASSGIVDSDDSTTKFEGTGSLKMQIGNPTVETSAVALYHLEETSGTGAYIQDSSATNADGTPTGTTVVDGFYGKARSFNGSSDYIDVGTGPTSVKSVEFWVNPTTTTEYFVNLTSTTDYIWANAGTVTATGFAAPTIYVNGAVSSTIVAGKWQHIAVTDTTAENASNLDIGRTADANYLEGKIDEVRLLNGVLAADSVAEAFRAGRDHRISKTISSTDLSAKTKLPFYVASDRPGTFLEATIGESAYANYEPDANTVGLWHLEEALDASGSIKDSSGNGNNGTLTSAPPLVQGKIGKARDFDGSADYVNLGSFSMPTAAITISAWVKTDVTGAWQRIVDKTNAGASGVAVLVDITTNAIWFQLDTGTMDTLQGNTALAINTWYYVTATYDGSNRKIYINGVEDKSGAKSGSISYPAVNTFIGAYSYATPGQFFNGTIDEVRISNTARTADEIRQAFEIGKRTHSVTIDFKADLDSSNLIANTSDLSFAINPDVDTAGVGEPLNIAKGEKIIVKENVNGTEYIAQGTVSAVTYANGISNANAPNQNATNASTSTITVTAWDSGATAPSGGFTTSATVFKWQREIFDLTTNLTNHIDASTRITLRVTDGSQGATVWLDDFNSADYSGGAMTGSNSASIAIGSTAQRYFQYRAILTNSLSSSSLNSSTFVPSVSLTAVQVNYNSGTTAQPPRTKDASTDFSATGASLNRVTDTGSSNSPSLELAYKELPKDINTQALYHFNSGVCATDSSGNSYTLTANGGMTCATGGKFGFGASGFAATPVSYSQATVLDTALTSGTIEAWINPANLTGTQTILYADSTSDTLLTLGSSGQINFSTSASTNLATANSLVAASSWYHIAGVWTTAGHKIYINGVEVASDTNTTTHTSQDYTTYIGVGSGGNTNVFSSFIDEVRISNIARTPEEIKLDAQHRPYGVYTSDVQNLGTNVSSIDNLRWTENGVQTGDGETPSTSSGLVAQWNFNETSGTVAANNAGTGSCGGTPSSCNGTVTSMTTTGQDAAAGDGWTSNNRRWGAGGLMFDGTDGHVTIPNSNTVSSVEMWVNPTSIASINIMQLTATATVTTSATGLITAGAGFTTPTIYLNGSTTDLILKAGVWNHVVVSSATGISTSTGYIGRVSTSYFKGVMDAVKLYNRALTATEILSNYQAGNVELQTRTGTTTTPNDGTWEAWKPTTSETALDAVDSLSPVEKISQTSLTAYWKLDETSGTRADSKGSNTLTDNNTVTYAPGRLSNAADFEADNSEYLSIADNTDLSMGDIDFTIAAWVYLESKGADRYVLSKYDTASNLEYMIRYNSSVDFFQVCFTSGGTGATEYCRAYNPSGHTPNAGQWYLVTAWHDSVNNKIGIELNASGTPIEDPYTGGVYNGTSNFKIGGTGDKWDGLIDEVAIWKRLLTYDERVRLYQDGLDLHGAGSGRIYRSADTTTKIEGTGSEKLEIGSPKVDSSTVGLWHLDETSGTGAYIKDSTANANDGTPTGTTVVDGFFGKARNFDGSDDNIKRADSSTRPDAITVEAWIKMDTLKNYNSIFGWGPADAGVNGTELYVNSSGTVSFRIRSGSGTNERIRSSASNISAGQWYHIAATQTAIATTPSIYINGSLSNGTATEETPTAVSGDKYIGYGVIQQTYFDGQIDEVRVSNTARSADEIAEAFRAGRDHRISKTISSTDLSAKTKLPFYVASDRPGTFLEATIGESALLNNFAGDPDLKGYWPLDENSTGGAAVTRNDYSGNGNNLTDNATVTSTQGKIGKAGQFTAANSEYLSIADNAALSTGDIDFSVAAWVYLDTSSTHAVVCKATAVDASFEYCLRVGADNKAYFRVGNGVTTTDSGATDALSIGAWHYLVAWHDSVNNQLGIQLDGGTAVTTSYSGGGLDGTQAFMIGHGNGHVNYYNGKIDQVMFLKRVLTADERRQMFEIGKRTHTITNDFVTSPQAAYSSGTSVTINNPYGTTNLTDTLSIGDTMIFKENVGGTETVSQAVVTAITNTSSVYGTVTLLAAPTFPSGGFTTNATVFKWQREFMDITGILGSSVIASGSVAISSGPNQKDAISRITLRVLDGSQGATVWLDDFKSAGPYLSVGSARTSTIASTPQQYFQYRVIFTTTDTTLSPSITHISLQYHSDPQKVTGADTFASGTYDNDGNVQLGSNNVKDVQFYDRTKDQISYALDFDGSNDYVPFGDINALDGLSATTVEAWIKTNSTSTRQAIVGKYGDVNGATVSWYMEINQSGNGEVTGYIPYTDMSDYCTGKTASGTITTGWNHLALVYDGAGSGNSGKLKIYVNGVDTSLTYTNTCQSSFGSNSANVTVGRLGDTNPIRYFNGAIDEVSAFNTARTAVQIQADYNARRLSDTTTGLVGLWHFDEGQGTRAYDSSSNGNHGTLTNMTDDDWVNSLSDRDQSALSQQVLGVDPNWPNGPARRSNALSFNGSSDYVEVSDSTNWDFGTGDFTLEAWINGPASAASGDYRMIIVRDQSPFYYQLNTQVTSGKAEFYAKNASPVIVSNSSVLDSNWHYIVALRASGVMKMYVDGVQQTQTANDSQDVSGSAANLRIGRRQDGSHPFSGSIDEVAVFNIARTTAQISSTYNARRLRGNETGLVALWHFDEGTDNTCSGGTNDTCDSSSNGLDGVITGATWVTDARAVMDNNARYVSLGASSAVNTDRGMELKITSTTAFQYRWQGDQTWTTPATSTLSSYSFTSPTQIDSTGVYVGFDTTNGTFGDESYFLIPSWALEQFSNSDTQNAMRGTKRGFPERSYLVATDKGVDILNADDNTLWMRTEQGSGRSLGADFNNDPSSIFMSHGQLFVGTNGTAGTGLYRYDFNRDKIYRYDATDRKTNTVNIAKRNTADSSYGSADTGQNLISSVINDAHALTIQGKLMLAAATDTGVTKISNIMSSDTSYDYSDNASDDYGHVVLAETAGGAGDLYADNDTTDALERWNNVLDDAASETAGTPDTMYDEASTPAIFVTAATEINDLKLTNQASTVEAASPTIYIAHDLGTTVLAEKRSDPTNGSVKYLTKDYVSEELIGDVRGMWPLNETSGTRTDQSVKTNDLTDNATVTSASGVRGIAGQFTRANSEYLSIADNTDLSTGDIDFTIAGWVYADSLHAGGSTVAAKGNEFGEPGTIEWLLRYSSTNSIFRFSISSNGLSESVVADSAVNSANTSQWHFLVGWHDATANTVNIQVDGGEVFSTATAGTAPVDRAGSFQIGWMNGADFWNGRIDEVLFTKEVLTAAQRTQLYVAGKEALNNKYRVKLASDTVNQLNGSTNITKAVAVSKLNQTGVTRGEYLYVGTNGASADDGSLSRILVNGDTRDREYDESTKEPYLLTDNDINSVSISNDGAYIVVGTDDAGVTIIQNGSNAVRLRGGSKIQGPYKRPHN